MKYNEQSMYEEFNSMLHPGESILCPIYVTMRKNGFLTSSRYAKAGFVTYTSENRLLIICDYLIGNIHMYCNMYDMNKLKIKKSLFGQYVLETIFYCEGQKNNLKIQIAPKIVGKKFPNQSQNCEMLLSYLQPHQIL